MEPAAINGAIGITHFINYSIRYQIIKFKTTKKNFTKSYFIKRNSIRIKFIIEGSVINTSI